MAGAGRCAPDAADERAFVIDLAFSANGRRLAFAGAGGVGTFDLDVAAWRGVACRWHGERSRSPERRRMLGSFATSARRCGLADS